MSVIVLQFQTVRLIQMMSLTFGLFTQVSGSGPLGPLVRLLLRQDFDLRPDCDLDLGHRNLHHVRDTPSHYALSFCEVSSTVLQ